MAIQQDIKRERAEGETPEEAADAPRAGGDAPLQLEEGASSAERAAPDPAEGPLDPAGPTQLGTHRFVYAAYFAGAIAIAFLASKIIDFAWLKLQSWKPALGEPRDEIVMPVSALVGALAAVYFWNRSRARELAEEVAAEMSKVTWPTRPEVTSGTVVVIVTTIVSTVFFALMDKFWGFVTNLVYGGS